MTHALEINPRDTYRVDAGTTETHARTSIDGTLSVRGTLVLTGDAADETGLGTDIGFPGGVEYDGVGFPDSLEIEDDYRYPDELLLSSMNMGIAVFLIGIMAITLVASWLLKNYAAGITWSISLLVLIFVGVFELGLELFWVGMITTILLLIFGMVVRWTSG